VDYLQPRPPPSRKGLREKKKRGEGGKKKKGRPFSLATVRFFFFRKLSIDQLPAIGASEEERTPPRAVRLEALCGRLGFLSLCRDVARRERKRGKGKGGGEKSSLILPWLGVQRPQAKSSQPSREGWLSSARRGEGGGKRKNRRRKIQQGGKKKKKKKKGLIVQWESPDAGVAAGRFVVTGVEKKGEGGEKRKKARRYSLFWDPGSRPFLVRASAP